MNKAQLVVLWGCYFYGQFAYILKRAYFKINGPDKAVLTYRAYFSKYYPVLLFRMVLEMAFFWLFIAYPDSLTKWIDLVRPGANWNIPRIPPVAIAFGLSIDAWIDWILGTKWLADRVPANLKELLS